MRKRLGLLVLSIERLSVMVGPLRRCLSCARLGVGVMAQRSGITPKQWNGVGRRRRRRSDGMEGYVESGGCGPHKFLWVSNERNNFLPLHTLHTLHTLHSKKDTNITVK